MNLATKKGRFESEVQLGMLGIILVLLFLIFGSNIVIYQVRTVSHGEVLSHLNASAVAISRVVQDRYPEPLTAEEIENLKTDHRLSSLNLVPSRPQETSIEGQRKWFISVVESFPPGQLPELARKLLGSEYHKITRGEDSEYFYVYPIPAGAGANLLITSVNDPALALLEGAGMTIFIIGLIVILTVTVAYLILYRYIFSPFKRIREQAARAGRPLEDGEDVVDSVVAEYQSVIDDLKRKEEKLLRLNEELSSRADSLEQYNQYLVSSIDSGLITFDLEGRILTINRAAADLLAVEPETFVQDSYENLFDASPELKETISHAISLGRLGEYREVTAKDSAGRSLIFGVAVSAIEDPGRRRMGFSVLLNDLTELHQLRLELETKHRLASMGEMAGGLAHQFRNSLGAISGYGTLIKRKVTSGSEPDRSAESLLQEVREAEGLISQFLDFTRPIQYCPEPTEIHSLIAEVVESFSIRQRFPGISLRVETGVDVELDLDQVLFKQALANILDNAAAAYLEGRGEVIVRVEQRESSLAISVSDTGCGIGPDDREKIFTPFYSRNPSGTGLGLPLVSKIVDIHGGRMQVESEKGQGTTFTVLLPLLVTEAPVS